MYGDPVSLTIVPAYVEQIMDKNQENQNGVILHWKIINNLRFGDDIDLMQIRRDKLQHHAVIRIAPKW